ncbi:hypothetical protein ColLi_10961 [Colletotrichum liriopes]|uniref:Uncharacterized protein n=1 Tax=Colletotrichum liriopes TaxID=708192 RepID=A0AA37LY50_9PEZI|nr:hypothetical protein ColLi_10961 [Colletotrichum liriopes]
MDWLKEQDLGEPLNKIDWKLEYDVPDHNAKLSISVKASGLGRPDIYVHCSQTSKDAEDRVNFLAVKLVHNPKYGRYLFMGERFVVHATLQPGMTPHSSGNYWEVADTEAGSESEENMN